MMHQMTIDFFSPDNDASDSPASKHDYNHSFYKADTSPQFHISETDLL
jgi:hypothetical protein